MIRPLLLTIGIAGPAGLLIGALGFQYLGDLYPCPLCIWQRWPHVVTILIGLAYLKIRLPILPLMAVLSCTVGTGIAVFHVGVEYSWWEGLASCQGAGIEGLSGKQLLDFSTPIQVADCSKPAWIFLHLSMAAWNGLASVALIVIWVLLFVLNWRKAAN